jgi:hypothetical protein
MSGVDACSCCAPCSNPFLRGDLLVHRESVVTAQSLTKQVARLEPFHDEKLAFLAKQSDMDEICSD